MANRHRSSQRKIKQRKRILLACEGQSERNYGRWLNALCDEAGLSLHIDSWLCHPGGGDLLALLQEVSKRITAQKRAGRAYSLKALLLDADLRGDNAQRDQKGLSLAEELGVSIIWQNIDHEAFLLRHFQGSEKLDPPKARTLIELQKRWPDYHKNMPAQDIRKVLDRGSLLIVSKVDTELREFLEALKYPQ